MTEMKQFFESQGREQDFDHRQLFVMNENAKVWYIEAGFVDCFITEFDEGEIVKPLQSICRLRANQLLFHMPIKKLDAAKSVIVRKGSDAKIWWVTEDAFLDYLAKNPGLESNEKIIDDSLSELSKFVARGTKPDRYRVVQADKQEKLGLGETILAIDKQEWVRINSGSMNFLSSRDLVLNSSRAYIPLNRYIWLTALEETHVETAKLSEIIQKGEFVNCVHLFLSDLLQYFLEQEKQRAIKEKSKLSQAIEHNQKFYSNAMDKLKRVFIGDKRQRIRLDQDNQLQLALQVLARSAGLPISPIDKIYQDLPVISQLEYTARHSKVRFRHVLLSTDWFEHNYGVLLAFTEEEEIPLVLIPFKEGYEVFNSKTRQFEVVTEDLALKMKPHAYMFYRPLPFGKIRLRDIFSFIKYKNLKDFGLILGMGLIGGLLGTITPIVTGHLFDSVIPSANRSELFQLTLALVAVAFGAIAFNLTRSFALLSVETKIDTALEGAIWDRLLRLPVSFFRQFTAGDLGQRANAIHAIRPILSGTVINSLLGAIFAVFNFILLFYYSVRLALVATGIVLGLMIFTLSVNFIMVRIFRKAADYNGRISGILSQIVSGIAKIRTTGSELRFFAYWAGEYAVMRRLLIRTRLLSNAVNAVDSVIPIISSIIIFITVVAYLDTRSFTTGSFLAFNAAFGTFSAAVLSLSGALIQVVEVIPYYDRAKPILETLPEVNDKKIMPGILNGDIEVDHVSFRYDEKGPLILKDLSFKIEAGDFVAVVGPSGSGKSTLLRQLLQFEKPSNGKIYYDNRDLEELDIEFVRRQIGVVLQNGQLLQGDILSNIIGSSRLTIDDAWEAAELAGLAEDIRAMPMNMFTLISEGSGGLSGGQKQRLLIARAIVHKPRILFFDEATSALDNQTQAIVSRSLEKLKATRIVIAHRLSTIINADKILVLKDGALVEEGNFESLMSQQGVFAGLAKRQML